MDEGWDITSGTWQPSLSFSPFDDAPITVGYGAGFNIQIKPPTVDAMERCRLAGEADHKHLPVSSGLKIIRNCELNDKRECVHCGKVYEPWEGPTWTYEPRPKATGPDQMTGTPPEPRS